MANTWFNEDVYLQNKLTAWQDEAGNADKDLNALKKAIADAGMTPESHFLQFGADEGLSPNEFFVIDEYVANQVVFLNDRDGVTTWTAKSFKDAVKAAGMTLWSHYQQYGWAEANPSNSFDAEQYFADKLTALQEDPATKAEWAEKTVNDVKDAFEKAGIDPVSHYFAYGKDEGVAVTPVDAQPNTLTEALAALADAQTAETSYQKNLVIDAKIGSTEFKTSDSNTAEANDAVATNYFNAAADAIAGLGATSISAADYKLLTKAALQDVDISTARTIAEGNVNVATAQAKAGMTALIEAANTALQQLKDANVAESKADTNLTAELKAFEAANTGYTYNVATNVIDSKDYAAYLAKAAITTNDIIVHEGKAYIATGVAKASATAYVHATAAGTEIKTAAGTSADRISNIVSAQANVKSADAAVAAAAKALEEAVGDIYVLEAGGHSVKDIGTTAVTATTGSETYSLTATDVEVFKTAADANKEVVTQSITFGAVTAATGGTPTASKLKVGDVTVDIPVATTAATDIGALVLAKINAESNDWTAAHGSTNDIVVLTAKTVTVNALEEADVVFTPGTGDTTSASQASNTVGNADVVNIGDTFEVSGVNPAATNADNLKTKLSDLAALEKAIADFQAAREIQVELKELEDAVVAAEKVLTDKDGEFGINLREGAENFTTSEDVYLFNETASEGQTLSGFGARGEDKIFFGDAFSGLVGISKTADNNGEVAELEIFWLQKGSDVELYVEQKSFAGNGSGEADMVKVILAGVDGNKLAFEDGFLTIA